MSEQKDKTVSETSSDEPEVVEAEVIVDEAPSGHAENMKTVEAPSEKSAKSGKGGWITAGILAAFVGGLYAAPHFEAGLIALGVQTAPPPSVQVESSVDLAPLETQIADLKADIARHQEILAQQQAAATVAAGEQQQLRQDLDLLAGAQNPESTITSAADLAGLRAEVTRLSEDMARLSALRAEADPAVSQLSGAVALSRAESAQLKERLKTVEAALQAVEAGALEASPRGRLVLTIGRMKDRALAGLPYGADMAGLRTDIAELPALDQQLMGAELAVLEGSVDGIRPYAALVRDFEPVVASAIRADEKAEGNFLTTLFTSRRTDVGATGIDAIFVRAERLLLARDVAGAVKVLEELEGAAAQPMESWRTAASKHVDVVRAFDRLIAAAARAGTATSLGGRP